MHLLARAIHFFVSSILDCARVSNLRLALLTCRRPFGLQLIVESGTFLLNTTETFFQGGALACDVGKLGLQLVGPALSIGQSSLGQ